MPVNLNPPPLPTPETARSVQPPAQVDDEAMSSDLFAQLVAAATTAKSPIARTDGELRASDDATDKPDSRRTDAVAVDAALALAAMPIAMPLAMPLVIDAKATDAATVRDAIAQPTARAGASRVEHGGARMASDVVDAGNRAIAPRDAQGATAATALRDQLAAALASRTSYAATASTTTHAADNDVRTPEPAAAHAKASPAPALAAALASAVERDRAPDPTARSHMPSVSAATSAVAPSPAPLARLVDAAAPITINAAVGTPAFGDEVATKIAHVVVRQERAELRVSPPDLGPVEIRIDMKSDAASLTIVAPQPATRDALEQALPQLRDALAAQGIALGQTAIHDGRAQGERRSDDGPVASSRFGAADEPVDPVLGAARVRLSDRLVDTFA